MDTKLEELLNELSVALMMFSKSPSSAEINSVRPHLENIAQAAQAQPRLQASTQALLKDCGIKSPLDSVSALKDYVSRAQNFLKDPSRGHLYAEASENSSQTSEMSADIDPQFLIEFIEKHNTMMEEFEARLIEFLNAVETLNEAGLAEAKEELRAYVKGYIHNVKGDAGSIGLLGIERACHHVEDQLVESSPDAMIEELLQLKGWVVDCIRAFAAKTAPAMGWEKFIKQLGGAAASESTTPVNAASPAPAGQDDMPDGANLDLLAELMADSSPTVEGPSATMAEEAPKKEAAAAAQAKPSAGTHAHKVGDIYKLTGEPEIFQEFAVEADDHLNTVESTILDAGGSYTKEAVDSIFRSIHSIKGSSSYFGLKEVTETSHSTENLLDQVRDGKREFDQGLTELVLAYLDLQRTLLTEARQSLKTEGTLVRKEISYNYLNRLRAYESGNATPAAATSTPVANAVAAPKSSEAAPSSATPPEPESKEVSGDKLEVKTFVKVDTKRLDQLIDAIGEMGIYTSMLIQKCRRHLAADEMTIKVTHQVEKVTRDVQNIGMSMRLIPIRGLFQKMSRLVWDLGKKIGKDIKFSMEGEDTELDRTIIDLLADPLMHMIRNAIDHGVEPPDERVSKGKNRTGKVKLCAYHSGGSIHVRIEDDGRGLDPDKLIKKAIEKGIVRADQKLSTNEAYNLIFAAGFSTAAAVTDVSGRGVGMDVVKRNIESLRGRVNIQSAIGKGTTFTIELPLTLAILDGIEIAVGKAHFLIPMLSVIEFIKPTADMVMSAFDRGETFAFRGKYLPVYRLAELFGLETQIDEPTQSSFIVLDSHGEQFALMVDDIIGNYSTVIKNLGDMFEQGKGIAGAAIRADGTVALILDVRSLLTLARNVYEHQRRAEINGEVSANQPVLQ